MNEMRNIDIFWYLLGVQLIGVPQDTGIPRDGMI